MMPLAAIMAAKGYRVLGSDRSCDQGLTPEKFSALREKGITLFPQDGSGITSDLESLIISTAVEDSIPDVKAAKDRGIRIQKRAELLAEQFNSYERSISIAGTSGKSTTTGMIAGILAHAGLDPTVMNGGIIRNFEGAPGQLFPNMRIGKSDIFVSETDESDGSIALYNPAIAVLNNIALDHKSVEEISALFEDFIARASAAAILNFDDPAVRTLEKPENIISYGTSHPADLLAHDIACRPGGISFTIDDQRVNLSVPGRHNVSNALAALATAQALGIDLKTSIAGLERFKGIARRLEVIGNQNNITVIDDFAHNPDKIAATLQTLREFPGRLLIMFQPHGYGPMNMMGKEIVQTFAQNLGAGDRLFLPDVMYRGGTVDRTVTSEVMAGWLAEKGVSVTWKETRENLAPLILKEARPGDRIVIMGARDDTLTDYACALLSSLRNPQD